MCVAHRPHCTCARYENGIYILSAQRCNLRHFIGVEVQENGLHTSHSSHINPIDLLRTKSEMGISGMRFFRNSDSSFCVTIVAVANATEWMTETTVGFNACIEFGSKCNISSKKPSDTRNVRRVSSVCDILQTHEMKSMAVRFSHCMKCHVCGAIESIVLVSIPSSNQSPCPEPTGCSLTHQWLFRATYNLTPLRLALLAFEISLRYEAKRTDRKISSANRAIQQPTTPTPK